MEPHRLILAALILGASLILTAFIARPARYTAVSLDPARVVLVDIRTAKTSVCVEGYDGKSVTCY
jgi:hypothetical protein